MNENTALVLLAAGEASRMGRVKQLIPFEGEPLIVRAVRQALASGADPVVVVLGAHADAIRPALEDLPVAVVENPRWSEGMGTSIQAGLAALEPMPGVRGAILALADQPMVTALTYARLAELHGETNKPIIASHYADTVGVPVYFSRSHWRYLQSLAPNQGCKGVILARIGDEVHCMNCPEAEVDLDTPADVERLTQVATS